MVTVQTTEAFDWELVLYREEEFTETSLIAYPWYVKSCRKLAPVESPGKSFAMLPITLFVFPVSFITFNTYLVTILSILSQNIRWIPSQQHPHGCLDTLRCQIAGICDINDVTQYHCSIPAFHEDGFQPHVTHCSVSMSRNNPWPHRPIAHRHPKPIPPKRYDTAFETCLSLTCSLSRSKPATTPLTKG